jgi:hypothetical protein
MPNFRFKLTDEEEREELERLAQR